MVWNELTEGIAEALRAVGLLTPERLSRLELAIPRDPSHGDWTTNLALWLGKEAGRPPRALAESMAAAFPRRDDLFAGVEVAGPGFLNFRYHARFLDSLPARIREADARFGSSGGGGVPILVEYVSANPTGPLNVVSARAAAVGACLVRLLEATGHRAEGEFYVNDAGNQVDLLGESVAARFAEQAGVARTFPAEGYKGDYVKDIASDLPKEEGMAALARPEGAAWFKRQALERMLAGQKLDLDAYGAVFSRWVCESEIHESGAVGRTLAELESRGMTYRALRPEAGPADRAATRDGAEEPLAEATFLRTARFGDDCDRVVVKAGGVPTYLLPDIAYHRDKRARGFRHAIDLWGPDHHGYVPRMKAALQALGMEPDFLEVVIVQQVNLMADGQPVKMSKRAGEFVTLRDLMEDIGPDCAKFFFLMRSTSAHLDFDLGLARRKNDENPAYYVQYAHARIVSVLRHAAEHGLVPGEAAGPAGYEAPEERALLRKLAAFPEVVRGAALAREPHRLPTYLMEAAAEFHRFYHACRVVSEDVPKSRARLELSDATRIVIRNGLVLMGVSAPERMARAEEET